MNIRKPAVSGRYYPSDPDDLRDMIRMMEEKCVSSEGQSNDRIPPEEDIIGGVVPHAGYVFSGSHAVCFFRLLREKKNIFDTVVIIHPIHAYPGPGSVTDDHDGWKTPLGVISLDKPFIAALGIPASRRVHALEHSAEVMVPMLQYFSTSPIQLVPVGMMEQTPEEASSLAKRIASVSGQLSRRTLVVASSDFSHFVHPDTGFQKDQLVLDKILRGHPEEVYQVVYKHHISACGYGPIMTLMYLAGERCSIPKVTILSRGHSGEVYPSDEVVDYISILFTCHEGE
jgi:MEMO1 family protein